MQTTVIGIGETGMGKSKFLNGYLQKNAFQSSDRPDSCTKKTSIDFNIINNQIRKAIDTPGIRDTDKADQENIKQMAEFLLNYNDGINVVAIVLCGHNDRFTPDTEKFIKIAHQMFNHPDFWDHLCIVFTKWYAVMNDEQKKTKQEYYKKKVIESIRRYTESDINIELPMFFVDSINYENEEKTKAEFDRFNNFAFSKNGMKTTQVEIPNMFYEKVIPEKRENYRYKENHISEDQMKRTEYFADQSRNKLIDYDGNISYSEWKNDRQWEIVKEKKIRFETKSELYNLDKIPIYQKEKNIDKKSGKEEIKENKIIIGHRKIKIYQKLSRKITTDFDGKDSYGDWKEIGSPFESSGEMIDGNFELYKYYKATNHNHSLKYFGTTMDNGWKCKECYSSYDYDSDFQRKSLNRFTCMQCQYDLCEKCMRKYYQFNYEAKSNFSNNRNLYLSNEAYYSIIHEHPLKFIGESEEEWVCDGKDKSEIKCLSGITKSGKNEGIPRFNCKKCNFNLCENCMNYFKKHFVYESTESYYARGHGHPFILCSEKNNSSNWTCKGKELGNKCFSGLEGCTLNEKYKRFKCQECDFNLCKNCMDHYFEKKKGCFIF